MARIEEQKRIERVEKMKILIRNAKITHIEKAIKDGLNKIPVHEKEKLETEEKKGNARNETRIMEIKKERKETSRKNRNYYRNNGQRKEKEEVKRRMKKKERDLKIAAEKAKMGDVKVGT